MGRQGGQDNRSWTYLFLGVAGFLALVFFGSLKVSRGIDEWSRSVGIMSPVERAMAQEARQKAETAAINALAQISDYDAARWHPLHFKPAIDTSSNEQCLACHKEILTQGVRETSPAGVAAASALAWYQTLDTYDGAQMSFHARHLTSPFAQEVMSLGCSFCHQGHDPREEAPGSSATTANPGKFALRKQVDPQTTCLLCHGRFPNEFMEGLDQPWHKMRENFESADTPNGCMTCHEQMFRTVRHQVNYLKADAIEKLAKTSSDVCFGCHGGRAWYRTSYPYARHPWPDMPKKTPAWAKERPTASDARHTAGMNEVTGTGSTRP